MRDNELLGLAAKAAGMEGCAVEYDDRTVFLEDRKTVEWNPLTDDGDALRLAVKLDIAVNVGQVTAGATWWVRPDMIEQDGVSEQHNGDPYAATRRAIVRAAAEIARAT